MSNSLVVDFGVWNAGRTHGLTPAQAQALFDKNCRLVHQKLRNGFGLFQEWDEADVAHEHAASAKIFGETHKWLQFPTAVPCAVPDEFRIARKPPSKTIPMTPGIERWSPHRVLTKGLMVNRLHEACQFLVGSTHIMRHRKGEADELRALHLKKLRAQFRAAAKSGRGFVLGLDGNDSDLPELHPDQKILYKHGIDYIIALDGKNVTFEKKRVQTIKTTVDSHDLGIATTKITWS